MIPYGTQYIDEEDIRAVTNVLRSDFLTQGPEIDNFEKAFSKFVSVEHTVAVNSATSALHLACLSIGLAANDILWTSPNSFVASANCARYCGAQIDFVDIDPNYLTICPQSLAQKLEHAEMNNKLPKALVLVHFAGQVAFLEQISSLCRAYGVKLIEDASHAIGAKYNYEFVGGNKFSDISIFSLHPVKIITSGEGGLLTTNNPEIYQNIVKNRSHGISRDQSDFIDKSHGPWFYEQTSLGYNYRMTDIGAALGRSQLKKVEKFISQRRQIVKFYNENFTGIPIKTPSLYSKSQSSHHLYVVEVKSNSSDFTRAGLFNFLRENGIGVNVHYIPIHLQPYYKKIGFKKGDFPNSESYYEQALSLPIHPKLTIDDLDFIVSCTKKYFKRLGL